MSDRPSPPGPEDPSAPDPTAATPQPDDTTVLPQQRTATPNTPDTAGPPTGATDPAYGTAPAYGTDPAYGTAPPHTAGATYAAAAPPRGPRAWWGQATSTGGGKAALLTAGVLGAVVVLAGVALLGAFVGRVADWGRHDRIALTEERSDRGWMDGPGQQHRLGPEQRGPQGGGRGEVQPGTPGAPEQMPGMRGDGDGMGMGGFLGRGTAVLGGGVLHGELTTTVNGTPTVMLVQTGEVKTYTSGRSLTVRSSDGFEATYSLDGSVFTSRVAARLVTGAQVRVVAAKEGMKVTRLAVVS